MMRQRPQDAIGPVAGPLHASRHRERVAGSTTFTTKADGTRWLSTLEAGPHQGDDLELAVTSQLASPGRIWVARLPQCGSATAEGAPPPFGSRSG